LYESELRVHKHAHEEYFAPAPETSKTADMEKRPITQIVDEVKVVGEDWLQSNF
jgi:hypothetical protein